MTAINPPTDAERWNDDLSACGSAPADESLASTLRVLAGTQQESVCLCTGPAAMPYIVWLRDGLKMSSRMIAHLEPGQEELLAHIQSLVDLDIRLAAHVQDLETFSADISRHRIDLVVAGVDETNKATTDALIALLNDCALLIAIADDDMQSVLRTEYADDYFIAPLGENRNALMMSRKGRQHRLVRRGGRRERRR